MSIVDIARPQSDDSSSRVLPASEWFDRLSARKREWVADHLDDALPPAIVASIVMLGGQVEGPLWPTPENEDRRYLRVEDRAELAAVRGD